MEVIGSLTDEALCSRILDFYFHVPFSNQESLPPELTYIDCRNSFPIATFQKSVKEAHVPATNLPTLFDSIRITLCLNLAELSTAVRKVYQSLAAARVTAKPPRTLVIISGLDVMYRSALLQDHKLAHRQLHDILLLLRMMTNIQDRITVTVMLPFSEFPKAHAVTMEALASEAAINPSRSHPNKKTKPSWHGHGNLLGDYIIKYFCPSIRKNNP
ncbi:HCL473Cp [Eremothecium sinecaudum]|uniref:HCL473Cp n=1 Tax=Eremothecium sinecaudum TaxID=45286 RepID=A0A109UY45_9SACH|nr:HCL473Cp [Eremothecium sinecaudum]AMD19678.1 HCL473Cp [Eremothecium sinecaudum]